MLEASKSKELNLARTVRTLYALEVGPESTAEEVDGFDALISE
jgi:hypothetical protein